MAVLISPIEDLDRLHKGDVEVAVMINDSLK